MTPDLAHLRALLDAIPPHLLDAIRDHHPGHPRAQAYDTDRTSSGLGHADPTPAAALAGWPDHPKDGTPPKPDPDHEPHQAKADLATIRAAIDRAHTALLTIRAVQQRYIPDHEPPRNPPPPPAPRACALHIRAGLPPKPVHSTTNMARHLDPPFPEPTPLCEPCYDFIRNHRRQPNRAELVHHDRTGTWKLRVRGRVA